MNVKVTEVCKLGRCSYSVAGAVPFSFPFLLPRLHTSLDRLQGENQDLHAGTWYLCTLSVKVVLSDRKFILINAVSFVSGGETYLIPSGVMWLTERDVTKQQDVVQGFLYNGRLAARVHFCSVISLREGRSYY